MKTTLNIILLLLSLMCMTQIANATNPICDIEFRPEAVRAQGFRNPVLPGMHADPTVCRIGQSRNVMASVPLIQDKIYLRIDSDTDFYNLSYSLDNKTYHHLAKMEYRYLSTETIGGFCGVHLGVYTQSPTDNPSGYVDVDWFSYETE